MKRITEEELLTTSDLYKMEIDCELEKIAKWHNKLSKLEDIEEEIGVDLVIKDKVEQASEVYDKMYGEVFICHWYREYIVVKPHYTREVKIILFYKDYGVGWALTKEELK